MECFVATLLAMTWNSAYTFALAARSARGVDESSAQKRAWGMPGARCTRGLVCTCSGRKHTSNNEYTGITRHSRTQWFYGLCRALPGDRALLPPSSRGYPACPHPVGPTRLPQDLTPASGRQDHTILPSAATSLVRVLLIAHRPIRTRPAIPSRAKRCRVHRIPPRVRDDGQRPSGGVGWREFVEMICPTGEAKYFCKGYSTQKCPTGKSPHGGESMFRSCTGRAFARPVGSQ